MKKNMMHFKQRPATLLQFFNTFWSVLEFMLNRKICCRHSINNRRLQDIADADALIATQPFFKMLDTIYQRENY